MISKGGGHLRGRCHYFSEILFNFFMRTLFLFTSSWCANVCIQIKTLNPPALVDLSWNGRDSSPQLANPKPWNFGLDNHFNAEIGRSEPLMVLGPGQDMFNHSIEAVGCLVDGKMGDEGLELWVVARLIGSRAWGRCFGKLREHYQSPWYDDIWQCRTMCKFF